MKKFLHELGDEFEKNGASKDDLILYGVVIPVVMIVLMLIAGWMDKMSNSF